MILMALAFELFQLSFEQSNRTPRCSQKVSPAGLPWLEHFRVQCYTMRLMALAFELFQLSYHKDCHYTILVRFPTTLLYYSPLEKLEPEHSVMFAHNDEASVYVVCTLFINKETMFVYFDLR